MTVLENFHFLRPLWLLAIPASFLLWWWLNQAHDPVRGWRRSIQKPLLDALVVGSSDGQKRRNIGMLMGAILATLAVAGPVWRYAPSPFADDPVPVLLVLACHESMDLTNIQPSRLDRAQLKIHDFAEARDGKPLGLLAFAGSAHLVLPPTRDTAIVATMASHLSPEVMPSAGDDLASALSLAQQTLLKTGGSIVLVTDNSLPLTSSDLNTVRKAGTLPIHLFAISQEGSPEDTALRSTASQLKASFTRMTADSRDIEKLIKATAKAPVMISNGEQGTRWAEDGWWLSPAIALLLLSGFRRHESVNPMQTNLAG